MGNAVLGGRELDVRLYTPVAQLAVTEVAAASIPSGTFGTGSLTGVSSSVDVPFTPPIGPQYGSAWLEITVNAPSAAVDQICLQVHYTSSGVHIPFTGGTVVTTPAAVGIPAAPAVSTFRIDMDAGNLSTINLWCASGTVRDTNLMCQVWCNTSSSPSASVIAAVLHLSPPQPAPWVRASLPPFQVTDVDWEITNQGGPGEGHVTLLANWEDFSFAGNERVDIWDGAGATLLYRGDLRLPESHLALPETKSLALYGRKAAAGDWLIGRRYVYAVLTDLATVAADLFSDVVSVNDATAVSDLQATGAFVQPGEVLDWTGSSLASALDSLIQRAPDQAIWGWDTPPATGNSPVNRLYVRPAASSAKYHYVVGDTVQAFVDPVDTTQIVNRIHITGGPALQPNLCNNGGFERPLVPDEHHGSLLIDGDFERSFFQYNRTLGIVTGGEGKNNFWTLAGGGTYADSVHPGPGNETPNDGSWWVNLDQSGQTVKQAVSVDHTAILKAAAWIRRGTRGSAATCSLFVDALNSSGTVLGTVAHPSNPIDPGLLTTSLADTLYQRVSWDVDLSSYSTCVSAQIRIQSNSGTGNGDGVLVDTCGLWYRDRLVQQAWISTQSGPNSEPSGPTSPAPVVNWVQKPGSGGDETAPLAGGYCIKVVSSPASGGWVEIQQENYAKVKAAAFQSYSILAQFKSAAGDATVTCGAYAYASDGSLWAVLESDEFIGGADGEWHSIYGVIDVANGATSLQPFVRIYSAGTVYFDNVMLVLGNPPAECLEAPSGDQNWWEGANYEWTVDSSNSSLALATPLADSGATYGIRERAVSQPLVIDRLSGIAFAVGYFQANAGPLQQARVTVVADERGVGLDGLVRVHGLPGGAADLPQMPVRIRWHYGADSVVCDIDLSDRRPDMAQLFLEEFGNQNSQQSQMLQAANNQTSAGSTGSGPYNQSSGNYATGAASSANTVHLTGDPQSVQAQTYFKPASDEVVLGVQREASGQTASLMEFYDETGAVLSKVLPSGIVEAPALQASGLTGAVAASRWVGATASGAPTTGGFAVGDYVIDQSGTIWICTTGGTPGAWASPGGLSNPMTTPADIIVGGTAGAPARLGKGADGQVLTVDPTTHLLVWATPASALSNPMTAQDDLIIGGAAGAPARLAKGSSGQVLTVDATSGHLAWNSPAGGSIATPNSLSGLVHWLDAQPITGLANGAAVSTWTDSSASANNVTQATTAKKPLYITGALHGHPVVRFSAASNQQLTSTTVPSATSACTIVSVFSPTTTAAYQTLCAFGTTANTANTYISSFISNTNILTMAAAGSDVASSCKIKSGLPVIFAIIYDGVNVILTLNGLVIGMGSTTTVISATGTLYIGDNVYNQGFGGDLGENLIYNRALKLDELRELVVCLAAKWGL